MRICRFIDEQNQVCLGHSYADGQATLLEDAGGGFQASNKRINVNQLLMPVVPSNIMGIGLNYHDHATETGAEIPKHPILFMKNLAAAIGPDAPIHLPASCIDPPQVDFEGELAVVIGKPVKNVKAEHALDYVLGYTIANDVSARRWQKHGGGGQWCKGKSFDTFCPLGPEIVTTDEISDPQTLTIQTKVNGELMQNGNTQDMIFSVAHIIEFLSEDATLAPGTVILTGTPSGVGYARDPRVFLKKGDVVEITIDKIGTLRNTVE
jgi:2-keto-4-pentenoate hydratase/2-oxohepta-3-ene-1,7-dioic acid hydratase in catechol pathway